MLLVLERFCTKVQVYLIDEVEVSAVPLEGAAELRLLSRKSISEILQFKTLAGVPAATNPGAWSFAMHFTDRGLTRFGPAQFIHSNEELQKSLGNSDGQQLHLGRVYISVDEIEYSLIRLPRVEAALDAYVMPSMSSLLEALLYAPDVVTFPYTGERSRAAGDSLSRAEDAAIAQRITDVFTKQERLATTPAFLSFTNPIYTLARDVPTWEEKLLGL